MHNSLLKNKIIENYGSIAHFCRLYNISRRTFYHYFNEERNINSLSAKSLSKICEALQCEPSDIGYTKDYWYFFTPDDKVHIVKKLPL